MHTMFMPMSDIVKQPPKGNKMADGEITNGILTLPSGTSMDFYDFYGRMEQETSGGLNPSKLEKLSE